MGGEWHRKIVQVLQEYVREGNVKLVGGGDKPSGAEAVEVLLDGLPLPELTMRVRVRPFLWDKYTLEYTLYEGGRRVEDSFIVFSKPEELRQLIIQVLASWKYAQWADMDRRTLGLTLSLAQYSAFFYVLGVALMKFLRELGPHALSLNGARFLLTILGGTSYPTEVTRDKLLSLLRDFENHVSADPSYFKHLADAIALIAHAHGLIGVGEVAEASRRFLTLLGQALRLPRMLPDAQVATELYEEFVLAFELVLERADKLGDMYSHIHNLNLLLRPILFLLSEQAAASALPRKLLRQAGDSSVHILYVGKTGDGVPVYMVDVENSVLVATTRLGALRKAGLALAGVCCGRPLLVPRHEKEVVLAVVRGVEHVLNVMLGDDSVHARRRGKRGRVAVEA